MLSPFPLILNNGIHVLFPQTGKFDHLSFYFPSQRLVENVLEFFNNLFGLTQFFLSPAFLVFSLWPGVLLQRAFKDFSSLVISANCLSRSVPLMELMVIEIEHPFLFDPAGRKLISLPRAFLPLRLPFSFSRLKAILSLGFSGVTSASSKAFSISFHTASSRSFAFMALLWQ